MNTTLLPTERAELLCEINAKQEMLFGIPITPELYDEVLHDATDSALFGILLALTLMLMQRNREC